MLLSLLVKLFVVGVGVVVVVVCVYVCEYIMRSTIFVDGEEEKMFPPKKIKAN